MLNRIRGSQKVRRFIADMDVPDTKASEYLQTVRRLGEREGTDILS